jgi:cystathionine beta-lyase/cystathionine gamma-synthase
VRHAFVAAGLSVNPTTFDARQNPPIDCLHEQGNDSDDRQAFHQKETSMTLSRSDLDQLSAASRQVHAGAHTDIGHANPTVPPLHLATAFAYPTTDEMDGVFADASKGYVYSRMANPTVRSFEEAVAAIEGTEAAVSYASGMAAIHGAIAGFTSPGATILASRDMYGTTFALLNGPFAENGVTTVLTDMSDLAAFEEQIAEIKPAVVYVESISNPLMRVLDVARLAAISHAHGAVLLLDNTFASPSVINGAALGCDVVIYSSTKHLSGHGDSTGGVVATTAEHAKRLHSRRNLVGGILSPFDAWLTLRGMRTLDLRVRQQSANAAILANWLSDHPGVSNVYYPSLAESIPEGLFVGDHLGSMLAFEIRNGTKADAWAFQDALKMIMSATTLGDVQSLVLHPVTSSHRPMTPEMRQELGITDGLIRLSAGIESVNDIISDLSQALAAIGR